MKMPVIVKKGDDPKCVHFEVIRGYIGTCLKCHQVRDYSPTLPNLTKTKARKKGVRL